MRWRGPSGQFLGSVRPSVLGGRGGPGSSEGGLASRAGRPRAVFQAPRCERSPSPEAPGWWPRDPAARSKVRVFPSLTPAGSARARWLRCWGRRRRRTEAGCQGVGHWQPGKLGQRREPAPPASGRRRSRRRSRLSRVAGPGGGEGRVKMAAEVAKQQRWRRRRRLE